MVPLPLALPCSLALRTTYSQRYSVPGGCSHSSSAGMILETMDAVVHYRHTPEEVVDLEMAAIPMMESIRRVSTSWQRTSMKRILGCEFFRAREASSVRNMLIRAVKHSRATLHEIF